MQYMPHVSKRKLKPQTEKELTRTLEIVLSGIKAKEEMNLFLLSILSDTEKVMLAKRLAIVVLLKENIPESTIADILHVTRETVARLRYSLELRGQGYEIALKELEKENILKQFKKVLISLARYSIRAAGGYVKPGILD